MSAEWFRPNWLTGATGAIALSAMQAASAAPPPLANQTPQSESNLIPGYFDPTTNTFKAGVPGSSAPLVKRYGTVHFLGTVALNPGIAASATVGAYVSFNAGGNSVSKNVTLTRSGPHAATLDVQLPYTWIAPSGALAVDTTVGLSTYLFKSDGSYDKYWTGTLTSTARLPSTNGDTLTVPVHGEL